MKGGDVGFVDCVVKSVVAFVFFYTIDEKPSVVKYGRDVMF